MEALEALDITARYGKVDAVRGISLSVRKGQIVSVIGPNGAGKSTFLSALMGMMPCAGTVRLDGRALGPGDVEERVRGGICMVPERRELFASMSVEDNLILGAYSRWNDRKAMVRQLQEVYARFPRLLERKAQMAGTLSGGERQMLALGRALMAKPRFLLLDEPSLGLAPLIVREILNIIVELRRDGVSILLVEQNARAALEISDYGYVLELGELTLHGDSASLMNDPAIVSAYLGGNANYKLN